MLSNQRINKKGRDYRGLFFVFQFKLINEQPELIEQYVNLQGF